MDSLWYFAFSNKVTLSYLILRSKKSLYLYFLSKYLKIIFLTSGQDFQTVVYLEFLRMCTILCLAFGSLEEADGNFSLEKQENQYLNRLLFQCDLNNVFLSCLFFALYEENYFIPVKCQFVNLRTNVKT